MIIIYVYANVCNLHVCVIDIDREVILILITCACVCVCVYWKFYWKTSKVFNDYIVLSSTHLKKTPLNFLLK